MIAAKVGCAAQTLHDWIKKAEVDGGKRAGGGCGGVASASTRFTGPVPPETQLSV